MSEKEWVSSLPKTRAECKNGIRPCPYATCQWHLINDHTENGKLVTRFDSLEEMKETCTLDVASQGSKTQEEVAALLGVSTQMVENIEKSALITLRLKLDHV